LAAVALRQSTMFLEWRVIDSPKICVLRAADRFNADGELKEEVRPFCGLLTVGNTFVG
jgi:hypothetical protein